MCSLCSVKAQKKGLTLVEIIVVLVVIAIFASIVIPSLSSYIDKANKAKLIAYCRSAVLAAQTLIAENAAKTGSIKINEDSLFVPTYNDIGELAQLKTGYVSALSLNKKTATVKELIYLDKNRTSVTYRYDEEAEQKEPEFLFNVSTEGWAEGKRFEKGDLMVLDGLVFSCMLAHNSGTTPSTRNPAEKMNKGTWEVVGTVDGKPPHYSMLVRYAADFRVTYNGNVYARTNYNLIGGQTPFSSSSSDYWTLIGPYTEG